MTASGEPQATTGYVQAGDLRIFYHEQGAGTPLVLLHGGLATAEQMWGDRPAQLAQRYRVLAPDTRGHGRTDNPARRLSYDQLAGDVAAFVDALGLQRPLVLGYSDGAQIAIELGLRHPDVAAALMLGGAVTRPTAKYLANIAAMGFEQPGQVDMDRFAVEFDEFLQSIKQDHGQMYGPDYWRDFVPQVSQLWHSVPGYSDEQLAGIALPTLAITGDRDEGDSLPESLRLYQLLPRAELAVIPNAGHGAGETDLFWQTVEEFLGRHGQE